MISRKYYVRKKVYWYKSCFWKSREKVSACLHTSFERRLQNDIVWRVEVQFMNSEDSCLRESIQTSLRFSEAFAVHWAYRENSRTMTNEDVLHYTYPHKPDALVLNQMHRSNTHMSFTLLIYTVVFPHWGRGIFYLYRYGCECAIHVLIMCSKVFSCAMKMLNSCAIRGFMWTFMWVSAILEVKMLDVEVLGWCGYTWSVVVRLVGLLTNSLKRFVDSLW